MKTGAVGLICLLLLLLSSSAAAQMVAMFCSMEDSLTTECNGNEPLPDGTIVVIYWDSDGDGPDGEDEMPPVGECAECVNFNNFPMNGESIFGMPGTFCLEEGFVLGAGFPVPWRFYLRVFTTGGDVWTSEVVTLVAGYQEVFFDDWTCGPWVCVPGEVTGLTASQDLCGQIDIRWNHATCAMAYFVFRNGVFIGNAFVNSYRDASLPGGTGCYDYQIQGVNEGGEGPLSETISGCAALGGVLPPVGGVQASTNFNDRVRVRWTDGTGEDGYEVWRTEAGHVRRYEKIATTRNNASRFDDYGARPGQAYFYRVNAFNVDCGAGQFGAEVTGLRVPPPEITFTEIVVTTTLSGVMSATTFDLDADDDPDVVACGMFADKVCWYENDGHWNFTEHVIASRWDGARKIFVVDLDQDGDSDILGVAKFADQLAWWENTPQGFVMHIISLEVQGACDVQVGFVNTDAFVDIVTAAADGGDISAWINNGSEQFARQIVAQNFAGVRSVERHNFDNDTDVDYVAAGQSAGEIALFRQVADHSFVKVVLANAAGAADVTVDQFQNVYYCATEDHVVAMIDTHGTETTITRLLTEPRAISLGDIDNDAVADVLVAANSEVLWWRRGGNRFYRNVITDDLEQASVVAPAMLEGDGGLDLLAAGGSEIRLYLSSADSMTQAAALRREAESDESMSVSALPREFALAQNYPNPFNPNTRIAFSLPEAARAELSVYDLAGRELTKLVEGTLSAGEHTVTFDASKLPSGVYFYRLDAGGFVETKKMVLLK